MHVGKRNHYVAETRWISVELVYEGSLEKGAGSVLSPVRVDQRAWIRGGEPERSPPVLWFLVPQTNMSAQESSKTLKNLRMT